jgi:heptosyltransferase-2
VDTEKSIYAQRLGPDLVEAAGPALDIQVDRELPPEFGNCGHVILNPGFSGVLKRGYRSHRAWPLDHWAGLIELIRERTGLPVVINGTEKERANFAPLLALPGVHSLFGSSLETLIFMLSTARCLVSVDTGTMHLSAALGTPVVALFGPTNPGLTGPYSKQADCAVLQSGVDCQPCFRTRNEKRCSLNRCMRELNPQAVFESLERLVLA